MQHHSLKSQFLSIRKGDIFPLPEKKKKYFVLKAYVAPENLCVLGLIHQLPPSNTF